MKQPVQFLAIALLAASASAQFKATPLTGTWSVTEIKTTGPNARTISHPQPGLLIFTGNHYSLMIIESDQPRAEVQSPQVKQPTADQLLATWGPFTAASGTYEISDNTLTTRPSVAKNPQVMAPGSVQINTFRIDKNILTLTRTRNGETPVANPTTMTFTKVE
jgi:Lipocalin-like domain